MEAKKCGTIVLFPFMAQGHLNPFIDLARILAFRFPDLIITIVSTPGNVLNLRPLFRSTPSIRLAQLPFHSSDHGLPVNIEHTRALSRAAISQLYHASQALQPAFHRLISSIISHPDGPPLLSIVSDMFLAWTVEVANAFNVFHTVLYTSGPYAMSIYNSIWTHLPHTLTCADEIKLPDLPHITIHRSQLSENMKVATRESSAFVRQQAEYCRRADGGLWNTVDVIERLSLDDWSRSTGKPVWAIGPLAMIAPKDGESDRRGGWEPGVPPLTCAGWLSLHPPGSVVYVSFGSQNSIGRPQMMELAKGLESSGVAFIWAVRPPIGFDADGDFDDEWLPEGFEDRMRERKQGLLIRKWAPQMEILGHPSMGAFISHCGWNSMLESLSYGVPVIGWPLGSEQFYNSKLLAELGVCEEMARGTEEMVRGENIERVVREVLEGEKGRELRKRAERLREAMKRAVIEMNGVKGSSLVALDEFVEILKSRTVIAKV
ncbi:UDP-glycosyltransferase 92A1-like [Magnolia sinica]|uniref:UDP-glycosyltransferase 92A1-like n=1 Tax=Magnolia sinica TaxID=86752 RepID=UPI0026586A93|nr:UDP-glycosyltransferase 92A1-like [Magnolia sinica]